MPLPDAAFEYWVREWREENDFQSSITAYVDCEPFRALVRMGRGAIPQFLALLDREPHLAMLVLRALGAEIRVPPEERGYLEQMVERTREWDRQGRRMGPANPTLGLPLRSPAEPLPLCRVTSQSVGTETGAVGSVCYCDACQTPLSRPSRPPTLSEFPGGSPERD